MSALTVLLVGCGSADQPGVTLPDTAPATAASAPSPAPSTDPHEHPEEHAVEAYVAMQEAYLEATETADPDHPALATYASGEALQLLRAGLISMRDNGLRGRGEATYRPAISSMEPVDAPVKITVRDCMDTSAAELYKASGEPYEDEPGGLRLVIGTVEIVDGRWKVTGLGIHEVDTCVRSD